MQSIGQTIVEYKKAHMQASADEILAHVKRVHKGCTTSLASVSSTLSRAKLATGRVFRPAAEHEHAVDGWKVNGATPDGDGDGETEEEARARITLRYRALERLSQKVVAGRMPSLIVSGPPGMGKSWTVGAALERSGKRRHDGLTNVGGGGACRYRSSPSGGFLVDGVEGTEAEGEGWLETPGWYDHIGGTITAVGLYHALWNMRKGGVLFLDDCDAVFRDEDSLNLLKVSTDSTKERLCSWRKNSSWLAEYDIDKTFDFQGHIVFLTNIDFEEAILKENKDKEHFKALIDRAQYLCLTLRTPRDFMIRIRDVADGPDGMLARYHGLDAAGRAEVLGFIEENKGRWYNLSLRLAVHAAQCYTEDPKGWKEDLTATKMRTR